MHHRKSLAVAVLLWAPICLRAGAPVTVQSLDAAVQRAGGYLVRHAQADGRFVYRTSLDPNAVVRPSYNIVRHAGTIYALTAFQQFRPTEATRQALLRTGRFLRTQVAPLKDVPEVMAVWSDPRVNFSTESREAKLGGTGLGLTALAGMERVEPGFTPASELRQLGEFLLFMQKDDGSYYSFYTDTYPGRDDSWLSLYYPGEAALGLLLLHELQPHPDWVAGANEALSYLARSRADQDQVPPDQWALIATAKLLSLPVADRADVDEALLRSHARQICTQMVGEQLTVGDDPRLVGCFTPDGRTTPTATRLEGLLAALTFLGDVEHDKVNEEIAAACDRGIRFLLDAQVQGGWADGGLPRAVIRLPADHPLFSRAFNGRAQEIRIDYVQHALSAWLQYREFLLAQSDDVAPVGP